MGSKNGEKKRGNRWLDFVRHEVRASLKCTPPAEKAAYAPVTCHHSSTGRETKAPDDLDPEIKTGTPSGGGGGEGGS